MRAPTRAQKPVARGLEGVEHRPTRPEDPPAEDHQQRRQQGDHHQQPDADPDRGHRPQARGGVHVREDQAQHAEHHGQRAGDDRRRRPVQGERHGLVPVLVAMQLFSISRDEQEGVVGAGAEHQHRQDAGTLPVDGEVGVLGEQVDDRLGTGQRHACGHDRKQPQQRTAVGQQQDDDDDEDGAVQQLPVDAGEGGGGVCRLTAWPGDVHVRAVHMGDLLDVVLDVGQLVPAVLAEVEGHHPLGDLTVLRHLHQLARLDLVSVRALGRDGALHLLDLVQLAADLGEVRLGQAGRLLVHQDGRDLVLVLERRQLVQSLGRLRTGGQPGRRLVVLDVSELAGDRSGRGNDDDP